MFTQFFTIGFLMLLSAMLPGPDFALVTKNTILYSRRAGALTALGISCAALVHMTYCLFGLAVMIVQSLWIFTVIKYLGASYLVYLGIKLLWYNPKAVPEALSVQTTQASIGAFLAFRQGFLCNLLNPKATIFFIALFTLVIKPETSKAWEILYMLEMFIIILGWFLSLVFLLSHPQVAKLLAKASQYIEKILGVALVSFGLLLAFAKAN